MVSDGDDDEVRSTGSHSQVSTSTGKSKGKEKRSRPPTTQSHHNRQHLGDPQQLQLSPKQNPWRPPTRTPASKRSYMIFHAAASALPAATTSANHNLASPKQQQPWQPSQQQPFWHQPQPATLQAPPEQQQQQQPHSTRED
ncbi:activating signal cointegrator 1 complex subunit 2 homolog [Palaemon carinicauda]|uniref:activating signal cointegrator 1 complex subunit 2 homolog n=1 Tax=Palaemon carinicauda TaxID=392227 RepID=UPI0035B6A2B6